MSRPSPCCPPIEFLLYIGAFFLANLVSLAFHEFPATGVFECWRILTFSLIAICACVFFGYTRARQRLALTICVSSMFVGVYAAIQKIGLDPVQWSAPSSDRVFSFIGNPNLLAGYCVAVLPLPAFMVFASKRRVSRVLFLLVCLLLFVTLSLTRSKGGFLGFTVEVLLCLFFYRSYGPQTFVPGTVMVSAFSKCGNSKMP